MDASYNTSQKYLLPIEFNEATKDLKRKLKYLESFEDPSFLFLADTEGTLSIYINSSLLITSLPLRAMLTTDEESPSVVAKKLKAAKDLSKVFSCVETPTSQYFLAIDTRFIGYKSGTIHDMAKLVSESNEHLKFIEKKFEQCTTFWLTASRKYNAELTLMENASKAANAKFGNVRGGKGKDQKTLIQDLGLLGCTLTDGLRKYFEKLDPKGKDLVTREETIQEGFEKIENSLTNLIMPSLEVVLLKLSTLRSFAQFPEKYGVIGLDLQLVDVAIERLFALYQRLEELNLHIVEAKLDIKNFYVFLNKNLIKLTSGNQIDETELALNPLYKYVVDHTRLEKFINNKNGEFKMEKCKAMLEKSHKMMGGITKQLSPTKPLDYRLIENMEKAYGIVDSEQSQPEKISELIKEAKEVFGQISQGPSECISKFYRPLQQTQLSSSGSSVVYDLHVEAKAITHDTSQSVSFGEEGKVVIKEANLCDSNDFDSHVMFTIKYNVCGGKISYLSVYHQIVPKKVCVEDGIQINVSLIELPTDFDLYECVFHGDKNLLVLLKPQDQSINKSYVGIIDLEKLAFQTIEFDENINNFEEYIQQNYKEMVACQLRLEKEKVIDTIAVSNLASIGEGMFSVLLHNRKQVFYR